MSDPINVVPICWAREQDLLEHAPCNIKYSFPMAPVGASPYVALYTQEQLDTVVEYFRTENAELQKRAVVVGTQLDRERKGRELIIRQLTAIYSLLYPPPARLLDGKVMVFRPKNIDPHEILQELSDRIRALPDEIERIANQEALRHE